MSASITSTVMINLTKKGLKIAIHSESSFHIVPSLLHFWKIDATSRKGIEFFFALSQIGYIWDPDVT